MQAGCPDRRLVAVVTLALWLSGCVSGHLLAAARRREYAREIRSVTPTDTSTLVAYTAEVVDDDGASVGTVSRTVRLAGRRERVTLRELTRIRTAAWFYPMLPVALALDTIVTPAVVLKSPAPLVVGD
jgi:hypothetical protein